MLSRTEIIIKNLINNKEYTKRVIPYIKDEYFSSDAEQVLFKHIYQFVSTYNTVPTYEVIYIELAKDKNYNEETANEIEKIITRIKGSDETPELDWLVHTTEKFCQERALFNAIAQSAVIFEGKDKKNDWGAIPEILSHALAVSFDSSIGHDYITDFEKRFEYYHSEIERIPTNLDYLNRITKGGVANKTLQIILAGTHVGKTAMMCNLAAGNLQDGKNVLYISNEMSEFEISRRIDANLFGMTFDEVFNLPKDLFEAKIDRIKQKTHGRLKIKEYPTASAHVGHIRTLLNELKLKQGFEPHIIYVDYMNIMTSSRIKMGAGVNSYSYNKAIAEELRGLAVERDVPIWTATQLNREGMRSNDPDITDVSESIGTIFTADLIIGMIATETLIQEGIVLVTNLKNRYDDRNRIPKFFIGFDRQKMKFYDLEQPLKGISEDAKMPASNVVELGKKNKFSSFDFNE